MASLRFHHSNLQFHHQRYQRFSSLSLKPLRFRNPNFLPRFSFRKLGVSTLLRDGYYYRGGTGVCSICCLSKMNAEIQKVEDVEEFERPAFDINLAVILAGFAFEAYTSPPDNVGRREVDAADCRTVYLSESFVREIYDGQLFIKLKKGISFPAMDPWGTSDPYVIMQLNDQVVKSKTKWGTKDPTWNEDFTLYIKLPLSKDLQVAAWDANLVTSHKRMGNASVSLEQLCDGSLHEVLVELEGMGGGGKIQLEVKFKSFEEIDEEKNWWRVPFVSEFLRKKGFETVQARQFVEYAFGQLKSFNDASLWSDQLLKSDKYDTEVTGRSNELVVESDTSLQLDSSPEACLNDTSSSEEINSESHTDTGGMDQGLSSETVMQNGGESMQSDKYFWTNFADIVNHNVVQKFGFPVPEKLKWDVFDSLKNIGLQSRKIAEANYIESGLAIPDGQDVNSDKRSGPLSISAIQVSIPDLKKATKDVLTQTDSIFGAVMVLTAAVSQLNKEARLEGMSETKEEDSTKNGKPANSDSGSVLDEKRAEEMKSLFSTAETAMEAWAMLATSVGHPSFIKSEFEKVCFLDNETTDTQVAIWRDSARRRLVVAFRGTEQLRWKDLRTDLMLVPAGLNPERIGGDFNQEVQVHSGFLSAYDSVRNRIISLIKQSIGYTDDRAEPLLGWHIYVTGHSLGGALATLLALELSSSQLAKNREISVTMYNFGSPRVGNKRFAEVYNEKVKDSWRVVNHRDIIPTVPRLMGYCHVAQPVYLAAGDLRNPLENVELLRDGYQGDVIGESTPDVLVSEFMKGEKELIEKILQTEINIFRSIRDGSALMQHMEDFYYVTLLENVKPNYQTVARTQSEE